MKIFASILSLVGFLLSAVLVSCSGGSSSNLKESQQILIPGDLQVKTFHAGLGFRVRHILAIGEGNLIVRRDSPPEAGLIQLIDRDGDLIHDEVRVVDAVSGTGLARLDNYVYYSSDTHVYRVEIDENSLLNPASKQTIISDLPLSPGHKAKSITIRSATSELFVNIGSPSNNCQEEIRTPQSPGINPCPELDYAAGIWVFDARVTSQIFSSGRRYATGIRNAVAMEVNSSDNSLYSNVLKVFPN